MTANEVKKQIQTILENGLIKRFLSNSGTGFLNNIPIPTSMNGWVKATTPDLDPVIVNGAMAISASYI